MQGRLSSSNSHRTRVQSMAPPASWSDAPLTGVEHERSCPDPHEACAPQEAPLSLPVPARHTPSDMSISEHVKPDSEPRPN